MSTTTDLWYEFLGGTGVESLSDLEFDYWAALSGLTPAEDYTLADHKYEALKP